MNSDIKNKTVDELLGLLENQSSKEMEADILCVLGFDLSFSNPDKAIEYLTRALRICEEIGYTAGIADSLMNLGIIDNSHSNYSKAMEKFHRVISICEHSADKDGLARCFNNIGIVFRELREYSTGLEYFTLAMEINRQLGNEVLLSSNLNNIGDTYYGLGDYDRALEYYRESLKIKEKLGEKSAQSKTYNNMACAYLGKDDYDQALKLFKMSEKICEELDQVEGIADACNNIGVIYRNLGDNEKAIELFKKSHSILHSLGLKRGIAGGYANIAVSLLNLNELDEALDHARKGLDVADEIGDLSIQRTCNKVISEIYERKGRATEALKYYKEYKLANDTINDLSKQRELSRLETKFEMKTMRKELEIWKTASRIDHLTGLNNRMGLREIIEREIEQAGETGKPIGIIMSDIDFFKSFNDNFGHDCGDAVLKIVAENLKEELGKENHLGRWGGEEFLIILPGQGIQRGSAVAESLRKRIEALSSECSGKSRPITMSFGVSQFDCSRDIESCIKSADDALYRAKQNGRNRCESAQ